MSIGQELDNKMQEWARCDGEDVAKPRGFVRWSDGLAVVVWYTQCAMLSATAGRQMKHLPCESCGYLTAVQRGVTAFVCDKCQGKFLYHSENGEEK